MFDRTSKSIKVCDTFIPESVENAHRLNKVFIHDLKFNLEE